MSSSVLSERAFSQGGITIAKHWNRLKGDIIEALQCTKCAIQHDLLFWEPGFSSIVKAAFNDNGGDAESANGEDKREEDCNGEVDDIVYEGWDELLMGDFDEGDNTTVGMNTEPNSD